MKKWLAGHERVVFFAAVLATLLAVVLFYHMRVVAVSPEAVVRSGVGADLLAGGAKGRQGLIGSLKWPPLPTLLVLIFAKIPRFGTSGLAFPVVNAVLSAFTLTLLNGWLAGFRVPRGVRLPLLCLYQFSPPVIAVCLTGGSATLMLLILMAGAYYLVHWLETLDVRSLAYLGVLGGLAVVTRYQTVLLVALVALIIVARVRRRRERAFRGGTVLVFLIPSIYTLALWFIGNWLIMGDPVFFLRGLASRSVLLAEVAELEFEWQLYVMPCLFLLAARTLGRARAARGATRKTGALAVAVIVLLGVVAWQYVAELYLTERGKSYFGRHYRQISQVDEIVAHLARFRPEAKVFVSGYTGYQFVARSSSKESFVHLMNLDLREIQRRTRGQQLFFLVPRARGALRWEDISLQAPWLFDEYMKHLLVDGPLRVSFVLEKQWLPDWVLIEAVRAERGETGDEP